MLIDNFFKTACKNLKSLGFDAYTDINITGTITLWTDCPSVMVAHWAFVQADHTLEIIPELDIAHEFDEDSGLTVYYVVED